MAKKDFRNSILEKAKKIRIDEEMQREAESLSEGEKYILERKRQRGEPEPTLAEKLLQERFSSPPKVEQPEPIVEEVEVEQPEPIFEQIEEDTPQVEPEWSANPFAKVKPEVVNEQTDEDRISWYLEKVKDERVAVKGNILEQDLQNTPATMEQLANLRGVVTRLQTSLTSLGGGGIGRDEVQRMISEAAYDVDSDDLVTLQENLQDWVLDQIEVGSVDSESAIRLINETVDSAFVNSLVDLPEYTTDDIDEGLNNKYYSTTLFNTDFANKNTDSLSEGLNNLYYTDERVDAKINEVVDSDYVMDRVTIDPAIDFKGTVSVADSDAPASPASGDLYVSDSDEIANATWVGVAGQLIVKQHGLVWSEADSSWHELGQTAIDTDLFVEKTGSTMTGDLNLDSGANIQLEFGNITVKGADKYIRAVDGAKLQSNTIRSVGNSNISISRNGERRFLIGTNSLIADKKIRYNSGYPRDSYTSDLVGEDSYTLMPKWYVDSAVGDAVSKSGDTMTGTLSFNGSLETIISIDPDSAQYLDLFASGDSADFAIRLLGGASNPDNGLKIRAMDAQFVTTSGNFTYKRSTDDFSSNGQVQSRLTGARAPSEIDYLKLKYRSSNGSEVDPAPKVGSFLRVHKGPNYADYEITGVTELGQAWELNLVYLQTVGSLTFYFNDNLRISTFGSLDMVSFSAGGDVKYLTDVDMNGNRITELGDPFDSSDAVHKQYVDSAIETAMTGPLFVPALTVGPDSDNDLRALITFDPSVDSAHELEVKADADIVDGWVTYDGATNGQKLRDIAFGDGTWVAVAYTNGNANSRIMRSTNGGVDWTEVTTSFTGEQYWGVAYGGGKFVAVSNRSDGNRIIYSTDAGLTWQEASGYDPGTSSTKGYMGISYGGGRFVAVQDTGNQRVSYSTDGINWTNVTVPLSDWQSVAYGDGTWVAIAWQGAAGYVMYSTDDAQTWTTTSSGVTSQQWFDVEYGDGKFVAAGMNPGNINRTMYSEDGINWTAFESAGDKRFISVAYGSGLWVQGGRVLSGKSYVQWSKDGINWNLADVSFGASMWGMEFANGVFIATLENGRVAKLLWGGGRGLYFNDDLVATERNLQPIFDALNQMASSIASLQSQIDDLTP